VGPWDAPVIDFHSAASTFISLAKFRSAEISHENQSLKNGAGYRHRKKRTRLEQSGWDGSMPASCCATRHLL